MPDRSHLDDLIDFVTASPSSYHAAAEVARRLAAAGFSEQRETEAWAGNPTGYLLRDGAVVAWRLPQRPGGQQVPVVDRVERPAQYADFFHFIWFYSLTFI